MTAERDADAVAAGIVRAAANELSLMVAALVRQLGLQPNQYELALAGGVVTHQAPLQQQLLDEMQSGGCSPREWRLVADPVLGAVRLARQL